MHACRSTLEDPTLCGHPEDELVALVREGVADGFRDLAWLDHCPLLARLRSHPEWAAIRAPVAEQAHRLLAAME